MKKLLKILPSFLFFVFSIYIGILILKEISFFDFVFSFISVLKPLWLGIIITLFTIPFIKNKDNKISLTRIISIYLVFMILILLLFFIFIYLVYENKDSLLILVNDTYPKLIKLINQYELDKFIKTNQVQTAIVKSYDLLIPLIRSIFTFITNFIFSFFVSFFITIDIEKIKNKFKIYISNYEIYFNVYNIFSNILRKFIKSTILNSIYIILTTSIILMIFRTPYALLLSLVLAIFNIFPYIGAILGNFLLVFIHFAFIKNQTILLLIILLINSQIESNLIHTWICNKTMKIHPISLFVSLILSEYFFGFIGIILSPLFASFLQMSLMTYNEYLNQKNVGGWEEINS